MGRVGKVLDVEADGNIKLDMGGGDVATADEFAESGDDSPPLTDDDVALVDGVEAGSQHVTGYHDETTQKAARGEKRIYARDPATGSPIAEIWIKGDGTIVVESLSPGGATVTLNPDGTILLGAGATLGVARTTDATAADTTMATWVAAITTFVNGVTPGTAVLPTDFGVIVGGSSDVKSA